MLSERLTRRPMAGHRRIAALVMTAALVAGACGSGDDESTSSVNTTPSTISDRDEDFVANSGESSTGTDPTSESTPVSRDSIAVSDRPSATPDAEFPVSIIEIDFDKGTITIANHGADEVDLGDVWLCEFPDYEQLDAQVLRAGESVTIDNPHDSSADDGELALYRTNDFGSADAILSYVEWGSTGHKRSSVAVEAGVWGTDAADAGLAIATGGNFAVDAADWSVLVSLSGAPQPTRSTTVSTRPPSAPASTTGSAPPPDDYAPATPRAPVTSAPAAPPPPPPDDYSPVVSSSPATSPRTTTPPPDEY